MIVRKFCLKTRIRHCSPFSNKFHLLNMNQILLHTKTTVSRSFMLIAGWFVYWLPVDLPADLTADCRLICCWLPFDLPTDCWLICLLIAGWFACWLPVDLPTDCRLICLLIAGWFATDCRLICPQIAVWCACWLRVDLPADLTADCRLICPRIACWLPFDLPADCRCICLQIAGVFACRLPVDSPADFRVIYQLIAIWLTNWVPVDLHIIRIHIILLTKTTAAQNEDALSFYTVRGLYFLAVVLWEVNFCCICNTPNHLYEHFALNSAAALSNRTWVFSRVYARVWFCALKQDFCRAFR